MLCHLGLANTKLLIHNCIQFTSTTNQLQCLHRSKQDAGQQLFLQAKEKQLEADQCIHHKQQEQLLQGQRLMMMIFLKMMMMMVLHQGLVTISIHISQLVLKTSQLSKECSSLAQLYRDLPIHLLI